MDVVRNFLARYEQTREEEMSLEDYLELCRKDPLVYATAAERMLAAIGQPELVDTRHDPRLSRIFGNKMVRIYPAFKDFYGLEEPIEQVVSHFRHAAQGLEEKKQILYLLGPVGGGKSSIAERLEEFGGDIRKFKVVKRFPSILKQIAVAKTEPGDENNQDISSLVGEVDIRKLEDYSQDDPDAYSY